MNYINPFLYNVPSIDVHGCDRTLAVALLKEFIDDYSKTDNRVLLLIHGKGEGILKKECHEYMKHDKRIELYKIDNFNDGQTIIYLRR